MKRRRKRLQTVFIRLRMSRIGDLFRWLIRGRTRREISQLRSYEFHQLILKYDIQTLTFRGQMAAVHVKFQIVLRAYTMQALYLALAFVSVVAAGCVGIRESASITFENRASVPLRVQLAVVDVDYTGDYWFADDRSFGDSIPRGMAQTIDYKLGNLLVKARSDSSSYLITAINSEADIVYRRLFTWQGFDDRDWIVILVPDQSRSPVAPGGER